MEKYSWIGILCSGSFLHAQQSASSSGYGIIGSLLPLILIFVIFYVLLILPQSKYEKKRKEMLASLQKGDQVVTTGGIIGTIQKIEENVITLKVAENVNIKVEKQAIKGVLKRAEVPES